ncbi:hypothetical protein HPB49_018158 [Dermacentor silvarum]|uniref:Uncharacterized protein n=1 Tax=Dermacentor silvarum TaxID=543639 RepID=A0ACB8DET7_DERSI|nr:hypothetical protein HPB49_018158 [Dermacentor silvarum]
MIFAFVALFCLVAVATAAPLEDYPPQPYSFSYDTTDEYGTRLTREESSDVNNNKVGSYSYTDAQGIARTVRYTADAEGFHATVETNEPGTKSSNPADALYTSSSVEVAPAPAATVVHKTSITNRDLKVNVTRGEIKYFDTAVHRVGDCIPALVAGNTSVTCTIRFDEILAKLVTVTKGDNLLGIVKSVDVDALVYNTTGRLEVTAAPNRPGFVRTLFVETVNIGVRPGANLDLNEVRMSNFKSHIANFVREEFYMNVYGNYQTLLNHAVARMNFVLS